MTVIGLLGAADSSLQLALRKGGSSRDLRRASAPGANAIRYGDAGSVLQPSPSSMVPIVGRTSLNGELLWRWDGRANDHRRPFLSVITGTSAIRLFSNSLSIK